MTREQLEAILKNSGAKADKDGLALPEGTNVTLHVAHDGANIAIQKIETVRFEGELLFVKSAKQTVALVATDVFVVATEGGGGQAPRRPAGFL